jgi:hypothetical protein
VEGKNEVQVLKQLRKRFGKVNLEEGQTYLGVYRVYKLNKTNGFIFYKEVYRKGKLHGTYIHATMPGIYPPPPALIRPKKKNLFPFSCKNELMALLNTTGGL